MYRYIYIYGFFEPRKSFPYKSNVKEGAFQGNTTSLTEAFTETQPRSQAQNTIKVVAFALQCHQRYIVYQCISRYQKVCKVIRTYQNHLIWKPCIC